MPTPAEWSRAFGRQAQADLAGYQRCCATPDVPVCHRLQFLQMACEKVAKAYLCASGSDPLAIQSSHAYTAKVMPLVLRDQVDLLGPHEALRLAWVVQSARPLAREIELLSPAVDHGGTRPANCEYPWLDVAGRLHVPVDEAFPNLSTLDSWMGTVFLKVLRDAVERFAR